MPTVDAEVVVMPDGHHVLRTSARTPGALDTAITAARDEHPHSDLYLTVDGNHDPLLSLLHDRGFVVCLRELHVRIPTDPAFHGLERDVRLDGVRVVGVGDVDLDALRRLDETIRDDIPGSQGWRWTPEAFRAETFGDDYDPALYRVAEEVGSGRLIGLVRVWVRREGPRLGCVGVLRQRRRTRLAWALLQSVARELHSRGEPHVVAEISDRNVDSLGMLRRRGVQPHREDVTLVLPAQR